MNNISDADVDAITAQLGRPPRAVNSIAHRCPCGRPDVTETAPRLEDGTPFPTTYYLTCPKASSAVGTQEGSGIMKDMTARLAADPRLAETYRRAHEAYLKDRSRMGEVPEIDGISAGGMPERVKCLHSLLAHSLAVGEGVNPFGDEVRQAVGQWWADGPCVPYDDEPEA